MRPIVKECLMWLGGVLGALSLMYVGYEAGAARVRAQMPDVREVNTEQWNCVISMNGNGFACKARPKAPPETSQVEPGPVLQHVHPEPDPESHHQHPIDPSSAKKLPEPK